MTKLKTRRKFFKEKKITKNKTKKKQIKKNKKRYNGGDSQDSGVDTFYYVFKNPLEEEENDKRKFDTTYLNKFIVNQYNKIKIGSFKKMLDNIDEKITLIKKGRTSAPIKNANKYLLSINNFAYKNEVEEPNVVTKTDIK